MKPEEIVILLRRAARKLADAAHIIEVKNKHPETSGQLADPILLCTEGIKMASFATEMRSLTDTWD